MSDFVQTMSNWAEKKSSWLLLFLSTLGLQLAALYFQYGLDKSPCVMCIYQRTAVYGILLSALLVVLVNNSFTRMLAFAGWAVSAVWGFMLAHEHVDIIYAPNPFFAICPFEPNFPSWLPLHEWIPAIFAAPGSCTDNSWLFLDLGMAEWMRIIFAIYVALFAFVFMCRLLTKKPF